MNNSVFSPEWISNVNSDLLSLHLALVGCFVSIFTLLYSFIISKKGELKMYAEQVNRGETSPTILQRQKFAASYIKRMSKVANHCLFLLILSLLFAIGSWGSMRLFDGNMQEVTFIILCSLTLLLFLLIVYLCIKVYKQYLDDIRI